MSDAIQSSDELTDLKAQADALGISYHPSIGADKLKAKIAEAESTPAAKPAPVEETPTQFKTRKRREASELVRVRVTCMNPAKRELEGEIFTAGNATVGTYRKFVPFGVDEGWHVPRIILNQLKAREFQHFATVKSKNGVPVRRSKLVKEFAVEELPPLTEQELKDLAQRQAMARGEG